ncbi:MAG: hypothetical protein KN64_12330 [Sulfurovum sp. AS07-7]|nr:MAG: hypothetical protein KN64_12330 [Sulfurovum sp. AS07-7]
MDRKVIRFLTNFLLATLFIYFIYTFIHAIDVVNRRHTSTNDGVYVNSVSDAPFMKDLAYKLTKNCQIEECKVQNLLDYVTNIPYQVNNYQAFTPKDTLKHNFGDCDDKSNLLISLLHALEFESYFVLVPKHIFIIVRLETPLDRKGLYVNGEKYYILESTAQNSLVGFELKQDVNEIDSIINPFTNKKLELHNLKFDD